MVAVLGCCMAATMNAVWKLSEKFFSLFLKTMIVTIPLLAPKVATVKTFWNCCQILAWKLTWSYPRILLVVTPFAINTSLCHLLSPWVPDSCPARHHISAAATTMFTYEGNNLNWYNYVILLWHHDTYYRLKNKIHLLSL